MSAGSMTLRTKMLALGVGAVVVGVLGMTMVAFFESNALMAAFSEEIEKVARSETSRVSKDILSTCEVAHGLVSGRLEDVLNQERSEVRRLGGVSLGEETVLWEVENQATKARAAVRLPALLFGGRAADANAEEGAAPAVDALAAGHPLALATVFQRMNDAGDMLRVVTNVRNPDGKRAAGTYVPAFDANGRPNEMIATVLRGETYRGKAVVLNVQHETIYEPVKDRSGRVVALLSVALPMHVMKTLTDAVKEITVGKTGYVYILGTQGKDRGRYIASYKGQRDGEVILDTKDDDGNPFIQELLEHADAAPDGEAVFQFYKWRNKGDATARMKIASGVVYKPWNWLIVASAYMDDYDDARTRLAGLTRTQMWESAFVGLCVMIVVGLFAIRMARRATAPLAGLVDVAHRVSQGDLDVEIEGANTGDEFGELAGAFHEVVEKVGRMVTDANELADGAQRGELSRRIDADSHSGGFREVIVGMNATLDAVSAPIAVTARYLGRVAQGDLPRSIPEEFRGDFAPLKASLERSVSALSTLDAGLRGTVEQQKQGFLSARCPTDGLDGAYRELSNGVNAALNAVISPTLKATELMKEYADGDLRQQMAPLPNEQKVLSDAVNRIRSNVHLLVGDMNALVEGAIAGRLDTRARIDAHRGDYKKIVEGMNDTLDAITKPFQEARRVLESIGQFDLRARMTGVYQGDFAAIQDAVNQAVETLDAALHEVSKTAEQVRDASGEIASSAQVVANGASQQAAALEESASSLMEMSTRTKENAENSREAKTIADRAFASAREGKDVVSRMVVAMDRIRESSESTAQIIRDINEIAFQTNLLALNAAVEAARAGDSGRGFSVVAEEVRSLALRSKAAAERTETLIKDSVALAIEGGSMSHEVDRTLTALGEAVDNVRGVVDAVAQASEQQAMGIQQVTLAVSEMDHVIQQSAASAEESSSAAQSMADEARGLSTTVARFQLSGQQRMPATKASGQYALRRPGGVAPASGRYADEYLSERLPN